VLLKETRLSMDTFAEISVYSSDKDKALQAVKKAFEAIEYAEKIFNRFDSESEISGINRLAWGRDVKVSRDMLNIIEDSIEYSRVSGGSFDVTSAPGQKGQYDKIILDKTGSTLRFLSPDLKIDLGGIAKGYAIDMAKDVLTASGIENALINIGGNIYVLGSIPGKEGWMVGIRHPNRKNEVMRKLNLKNKGIATSGDYERGQHIINPATGGPSEGIISATVIADSAEEADAFSTAVFVMGPVKTREFLRTSGKSIEIFILDVNDALIEYP
jgi:thiamine biosynthesis lipoprotein